MHHRHVRPFAPFELLRRNPDVGRPLSTTTVIRAESQIGPNRADL